MSFIKDHRSYIIQPYHVLNYNSRKSDGSVPQVKIGKYCSIAENCRFIMANHLMDRVVMYPSPVSLFAHGQGNSNGYSRGDIIIKNDVWIGSSCIIMDNIEIGNGAVISAGSVVTKSVEPYAIVGGNPAKLIKYRFPRDIIERLENLNIWNLPNNQLDTLDLWTSDIESFITNTSKLLQ
jgi:acetyltransferase-like isoleucine patch superfamily enzyme